MFDSWTVHNSIGRLWHLAGSVSYPVLWRQRRRLISRISRSVYVKVSLWCMKLNAVYFPGPIFIAFSALYCRFNVLNSTTQPAFQHKAPPQSLTQTTIHVYTHIHTHTCTDTAVWFHSDLQSFEIKQWHHILRKIQCLKLQESNTQVSWAAMLLRSNPIQTTCPHCRAVSPNHAQRKRVRWGGESYGKKCFSEWERSRRTIDLFHSWFIKAFPTFDYFWARQKLR